MISREDTVKEAAQVEGFMPENQLRQIYDFTEQYLTPGGTVCEIGTWKGRSTYVMAAVAREKGARVIAIDTFAGATHKDYDTYREALLDPKAFFDSYAGKALADFDNITFLKESSETAFKKIPDGSLDICFIDGDHDDPTVTSDIHYYYSKVRPKGLLYGHDFYKDNRNGVQKACNTILGGGNYKLKEDSLEDGTIWYYEKPPTPRLNITTRKYRYLNPGNYLRLAFEREPIELKRDVELATSPGEFTIDVYWFLDNNIYDGNRSLMETRVTECQYAFYTQPPSKEYFEKKKNGMAKLAMFAADPTLHFYTGAKKTFDLGFIGEFRNRSYLLNELFQCFTCDLRNGGVEDPKKYSEVLSGCKILFNKADYNEINMRVFESMAIGCLLTNRVPGIEEVGEDGRHFVLYDGTLDDAKLKIQYLLNHPEVREKIEKEARKLVLEKHTYRHRLLDILKFANAL